MGKKGLLIVLSGPSGAGKGTLCKELLKQLPNLNYSVSATTRAPREGEMDGVHYFFKSKEEFERMLAANQFLEHAEYVNNLYGTPRFAVEEAINEGRNVILEIEIQGALQIKRKFPKGVFIFVVPPSMEELKARICKRGTETEDNIKKRLDKASVEQEYITEYDYAVVNDQVADAVEKIKAIITAERCRVKRQCIEF
ncbi:MAG TPA: guanylate kinase [Verrucomicrobiae bacterium]|nr:guanylate kinase [Verrucomicrobiae bacterium]